VKVKTAGAEPPPEPPPLRNSSLDRPFPKAAWREREREGEGERERERERSKK